jgi:hypothetical protein
MVRFMDLKGLEARDFQAVVRRAGTPAVAAALKGEAAVWETLKDRLPEGLRQRLGQEIELSTPPTPERLAIEKRKVVEALKGLIKEGWVVLNRGNGSGGGA